MDIVSVCTRRDCSRQLSSHPHFNCSPIHKHWHFCQHIFPRCVLSASLLFLADGSPVYSHFSYQQTHHFPAASARAIALWAMILIQVQINLNSKIKFRDCICYLADHIESSLGPFLTHLAPWNSLKLLKFTKNSLQNFCPDQSKNLSIVQYYLRVPGSEVGTPRLSAESVPEY